MDSVYLVQTTTKLFFINFAVFKFCGSIDRTKKKKNEKRKNKHFVMHAGLAGP